MDIYHNLVLFWYIWGVLNPEKMIKTVRFLIYYVGLFILVKYMYTLVPEFDTHTYICF